VTRWEYSSVLVRESVDPSNALDSYGSRGWELVACYKIGYTVTDDTVRFIFKCPIKEEPEK
jgi:hypothetical protein